MLVDTSVWIDHFRRRNTRLVGYLEKATVAMHPFIVGELGCGNLPHRADTLGLLRALPSLPVIEHDEVLEFVAALRLHGRGLGWIDMHLLAAAKLARVPLWTVDKRLAAAAADLGIGAEGK